MEKINLRFTDVASRYKHPCPKLKSTGNTNLTVCCDFDVGYRLKLSSVVVNRVVRIEFFHLPVT